MSENQEPPIEQRSFAIVVPNAPELPLLHVNALSIANGVDEFFFTFGTVVPPDLKALENAEQSATQLVAQPVIRFVISPTIMAKFIQLMQTQLEQQQELVRQIGQQEEAQR